jgi:hypothetical protein
MHKQNLPYLFLGTVLLLFGLVGCDLQRLEGGDITQVIPDVGPTRSQEVFTPPEAAQAGQAIVRVQPATQELAMQAVTTVEIQISDVTDLAGADVELRFNPAVLQVQDADPAADGVQVQPGSFLQPDFVVTNEADNTAGVVRYILTQRAGTPPAAGQGVLASINFQAVTPGASDLTFTITKLANSASLAIPVTPQGGQIIVPQPDQPTVEPTPGETVAPTAGPTLEPTLVPTTTTTPAPTPLPTDSPTAQPTLPPPTPAPTATLPPLAEIPPGATFGFCYRVRPGEENIHFLAQKFATTPYAINLVNDLHPPSYIFTHQILFMPEQLGRGPNAYIIQAGDTLTSIAAECHLTPKILLHSNHLDPEIDPDAPLPAGEGLIIPIPYFPPPSRFPYPPLTPPCCYGWLPYQPGPPVYYGK